MSENWWERDEVSADETSGEWWKGDEVEVEDAPEPTRRDVRTARRADRRDEPAVAEETAPAAPTLDETDDARAGRSFARTNYMDGLKDAGSPSRPRGEEPVDQAPISLNPVEANPDGTAFGRAAKRGLLRTAGSLPQALATADAQAIGDSTKDDLTLLSDVFKEVTGMPSVPEGADLSTPELAAAAISKMGYPDSYPSLYRQLYEQRRLKAAEARAEPERFLERGATNIQSAESFAKRAEKIPMSAKGEEMKQVFAATPDTFGDTISAIVKNPSRFAMFLAETAAESTPQMAAALATTALTRSPSAAASVLAAGTVAQEFGSSAREFLQENDVRLESEADVISLLNNPDLMKKAAERGMTRGVVIAAFEVLGQGAAASTLMKTPLGNALVDVAVQGATGAGGESAARFATGQEQSAREILIEGLAEGVTAPIEVGAAAKNTLTKKRDDGPPAPDRNDRERIDSARLTPEDRASPLRNDVIDDGKAIIDELLGDAPPAGAPTSAPSDVADNFDLPDGAVPLSDLYGDIEPDAEAGPAGPFPIDTPTGDFIDGNPQESQDQGGETSPPLLDDPNLNPNPDAIEQTDAELEPTPVTEGDTSRTVTPVTPAAAAPIAARNIEVLDNDGIQSVETDAETFQYKAGGDQDGVTDRLKNVKKWESDRTGVALVYEYADGRRVIVDGHQRLGLAKKLAAEGQEIDLPVRVLREVDGVSVSDARRRAAEKNIAEGTGTALDAAKVLRETGKTAQEANLPTSESMVRTADGIAKLSDDAYGMVVNEVASQRDGALVGSLVKDQARHNDILGLLARVKPSNAMQAESIVRQAMDTEVRETQTSLFGEEEVSANLYLERAKVLDRAMKDLRMNQQTFKVLVERGDMITETGNNVLDQEANASEMDDAARARAFLMKEANTKGPISDALTAAARAIKDGEKPGKAARDFLIAIRSAGEGNDTSGAGGRGAGSGNEQARPDGPAENTGAPNQAQTGEVTGGARSGTKDGGRTDVTPEGDQSVMPGFEKASDRDVAQNQMDKPMRGGDAATQEGGLFDEGARNQDDMFGAPEDRPTAAPQASDRPAAKGQIGTNGRGNPLFEDENGVRYYTEKGVRVSESVNIVPGQGSYVDPSSRKSDYLTEAERDERAEERKKTLMQTLRMGINFNKMATEEARRLLNLTGTKEPSDARMQELIEGAGRIDGTSDGGRDFSLVGVNTEFFEKTGLDPYTEADFMWIQVNLLEDKKLRRKGSFLQLTPEFEAELQGYLDARKGKPQADTAPTVSQQGGPVAAQADAWAGKVASKITRINSNDRVSDPINENDEARIGFGQLKDGKSKRSVVIKLDGDGVPRIEWMTSNFGDKALIRAGTQLATDAEVMNFLRSVDVAFPELSDAANDIRSQLIDTSKAKGRLKPNALNGRTELHVTLDLPNGDKVDAVLDRDFPSGGDVAFTTDMLLKGLTWGQLSRFSPEVDDALSLMDSSKENSGLDENRSSDVSQSEDPSSDVSAAPAPTPAAKPKGPTFTGARADNTSSMTMEEQDRLAALRARFRDKSKNQTSSGLDPELLSIAAEMGSIYIKAGARKFRDLVRAMMEDLGLTFDQVQPYARAAYNQTRGDMDLDGVDVSDMDTDAQVIAEVKAMRAEAAAPDTASEPEADTPAAPTPSQPEASPIEDAMGGQIVTHITKKGKELRGYVLKDVTLDEAKKIDPYAFRKDGGMFVREAAVKAGGKDADQSKASPEEADSAFKGKLVDGFKAAFAKGEKFDTIIQARKKVEEYTGTPYSPFMAKDLEEAIEVAVVMQARTIIEASSDMTDGMIYDRMVELYDQQPNLAQRTSTSIEMQAYSTPAPLAYLTSRLAQIDGKTKVYEPSAGNGMLLIEADPLNIIANELQESRVDGLRRVLGEGATITKGDAMESTASGYRTVITNPPFGKVRDDLGKTTVFDLRGMGDATTQEIDHAIVARALDGLPSSGGRAVLIIGGQKGANDMVRREEYVKGEKRKFFKRLYDNYNVTEHFTADGKLYQKQGAGWPVDVIVIEGRGASAKPYPMKVPPVLYSTWDALGERLNGKDSLDTRRLDDGDRDGNNEAANGSVDAESVPSGPVLNDRPDGAESGPRGGVRGSVDGGADGRPDAGAVSGAGGGRAGVRVGAPDGAVRDAGTQLADTGSTDQAADRADGGTARGANADRVSGDGVSRERIERNNEEAETSFQVQYEPRSNATFAVGTLVPKNMQQAMGRALDDLQRRISNQYGDIDGYVAAKLDYSVDEALGTDDAPGYFSAEQMDALALAIDNVEQGNGFIIGDQTGVGKGRFVAAMLRYASLNDMVPVFVSKDAGLYADMIRDMRDIGMDTAHKRAFVTNNNLRGKNVLPLSAADGDILENVTAKPMKAAFDTMIKTGRLPKGYDFLFTTYSQMQQVKGQSTQRMAALEGISSNAMFVLDESHEAGGGKANERGGSDGEGEGKIPRAQFIRQLLLESKGAVFSSATYAKNPSVMSLYAKTDLSLAVDKIEDLESMITSGGVPLQQVMANMLVESGQYARRERSYEGVEMNLKQLVTDKEMAKRGAEVMRTLFNLDVQVMQDVRDAFIQNAEGEGMAGVTDASVGGAGMSSTNFASTMHNVAAQFLLAIKVKATIAEAIELHKSGKKPIIALSNTNASIIKEAADQSGVTTGQGLNVPFNKILERYLERLRRITLKDDDDNKSYIFLTDNQIREYGGGDALQAFNDAKRFIEQSDLSGLPGSPIDAILDGLTEAGIAADEITGRNITLRNNVLESREASPAAKKRVMNAYNSGELDALVINRSGSTGFSMHATDKEGNDGKERHMIILQPEPNIDLFMQMLGRIHRTGQIKLPGYTIAVSDLAVEKRPAAVLMRKMASLNANTTASKKSAISLDNVVDFLNAYGDEVVVAYLRENPMLAVTLDIGIPKKADTAGTAAKFTGRLVSLPPEDVTRIYDDIEGAYTDYIDALDRMGMNALEAKVLELDAKTLDETELVPAKDESSPFGQAAFVQTVDVKRLGKPYSPEQLEAELEKATGGNTGDELVSDQISELRGMLAATESKVKDRLAVAEAKVPLAKTDKQKQAASDAVNRVNVELAGLYDKFTEISNKMLNMSAGTVGVISIMDGDSTQSFAAMSLGSDISRAKGNPTAASNIVVRVAIADAGREVRVPLSGFMAEGKYEWREIPMAQRNSVIDAFKEGQSESRENRQMVTGNIPAGFAQFKKGQIVIYTDDSGALRQGIILPKNFEAATALESRPVKMSPDQVVDFLMDGDFGARVVQTEDGTISISYNGDIFGVLIKTQGHKKYTLNRAVQKIVGEFEQRRGAKFFRKEIVEESALIDVLSIYADNLGTEYSTTIDRNVARRITGEVLPDIQNLEDGPATPRFARSRAQSEVLADLDPASTEIQAGGQLIVETTPKAKEKAAQLGADMNKELSKLGLPSIKSQVVESAFGMMGDGEFYAVDGTYFQGLITVAMNNARGAVDTLRHEAIHALRSPSIWGGREFGLFRKAEWNALEAAAAADTARMAEIAEAYPNETQEFMLEEAIADMFGDYAAGRMKPKGFVASGMKRIQQAYEAISNAFKGNGFTTAESVFAKAASGQVGARRNEGRGRIEPTISRGPSFAVQRDQERTNSQVSKLVGEEVTHAVKHDTSIQQRQETFVRSLMTQPLDTAFRVPFMMVGGLDKYGRWRYGKAAHDKLAKAITDTPMGFMSPIVDAVRAGMIDRYGLSSEYVERDRRRGIDEAMLAAEGTEHVKALMDRNMGAQEAKVLQAVLTGEAVAEADMAKLAEPVRVAIDGLGSEAVALGLISRESYERNRGTYLHRVYEKHEFEAGHVGRWADRMFSGRRRKIIGNQFKGRGIFEEVEGEKILRDNLEFLSARRGKVVKGEKIIMLELRTTTGTDPLKDMGSPKGRVKRRVYWPAGKPIPAKLSNYENRGTFEVRGEKGSKVVLWRDFTKQERTKMGEVLDARYTIAKTYAVMSKDLATGRFFKDIAENEDWSRTEPPEGERVDIDPVRDSLKKRLWATPDLKWVLVPNTKISKSDAYQYGALAGRYVRAEIWRDMEETRAMSSPNFYQKILTQWKLNKTARSPVVHMNNVMSNFMLMDMADVRMPDLVKGIRSMATGDQAYQEAATAGAFGADMVTQELRDNVLKPLMKELANDLRGDKGSLEGTLGGLGKIMDKLTAGIAAADQKMISAYQMEDQVFRMATYIRRRQQGMSVDEAAVEARDQFLNYDIRAPWVNVARRTVLPFASYTYRAVPKIAETIAQRPWKIAKYIAIYQGLNMVSYALAPSEWDEEEERKSLRKEESGMMGFLGIPVSERLLRMPYLSDGNPVFLDVRRWIPAGDVFDTRGGDLPSPLHMGGPLISGMELYFNRSAFTGNDIVNPMLDTAAERAGKRAKFAYQSFVPSAPWVPGSWYFEKIKRAVFDDALQWGNNEPYDPAEAILSSVGIKLKPKDVELGYRSWQIEYDRHERELAFARSSLKRQAQRQMISREVYEKEFAKLAEKRAKLRAEKIERFE